MKRLHTLPTSLFVLLATVATTRKERYVVELDAVTAFRFQPEGAGPGY